MGTRRSDADSVARFREVAARWRYATTAVAVLLVVFLAMERDRLHEPIQSAMLVFGYLVVAIGFPARKTDVRLPLVSERPSFFYWIGFGIFVVSTVAAVEMARYGAPDTLIFVAFPLLWLSNEFRYRYERLVFTEKVAGSRRLSVTIPLVDESGPRFRQSDVALDIETDAGVADLLDRVQGVLKLPSIDVRDDVVRAVSLPVFKVKNLPQLWESLRRKGVEVEAREELTMENADGAVIHARG
jgi:hypothetical protein